MKLLKNYEKAVIELTDEFVKKHFDSQDYYWVGNDIGDVLNVGDWFFNLSDIVDYTKYNYTTDNIIEYYDYYLDCNEKNEIPVNIKNYLKLNG